MSDDTKCLMCATLFACLFGAGLSHGLTRAYWEYQAVQHKAAEYDRTTGNWKWINPPARQSEARP